MVAAETGILRICTIAVALMVCTGTGVVAAQGRIVTAQSRAKAKGAWSQPQEPFRIVGNLYYVGAVNIASYLLATPEGHILIDTGGNEMVDMVPRNIEKVGFKLGDVKIILSTEAHFDHVQAHASMQRRTGARVMALGTDAKALASGKDLSPIQDEGWEPVDVSRVLKGGDTVSLGGTMLRAVSTPGHSDGATTWTTIIRDGGRNYEVVIYPSLGVNPGVPLIGNLTHPNVVENTLGAFPRLRALDPDIQLPNHPQRLFEGKIARIVAGERPHPLLLAPGEWRQMLKEREKAFLDRVEAEKAQPGSRER